MLIILSPAKSLDYTSQVHIKSFTLPGMTDYSVKLMARLKKLNPLQLADLMHISRDLAELNFQRFQTWQLPFTPENARQAVLAFNGDAYQGLQASTLSEEVLIQAQSRLRILSGLYGVLRPLDLILPYRLEMGTKLATGKTKDLYQFWGLSITRKIREALDESEAKILLNLASQEYFKSIDTKTLKAEVITPEFKDLKNGEYKMISFYAKRARGLMTRFVLENGITDKASLQAFDAEGYAWNPRLSKINRPVFTRDHL